MGLDRSKIADLITGHINNAMMIGTSAWNGLDALRYIKTQILDTNVYDEPTQDQPVKLKFAWSMGDDWVCAHEQQSVSEDGTRHIDRDWVPRAHLESHRAKVDQAEKSGRSAYLPCPEFSQIDLAKIANAITETAESMGHHWDNDSFKINDWLPRWRALAKLIGTSGAKAMEVWSSGAKIHREETTPVQPQGVSDEPKEQLKPVQKASLLGWIDGTIQAYNNAKYGSKEDILRWSNESWVDLKKIVESGQMDSSWVEPSNVDLNQPLHPLTVDGKVTQVGVDPETNSDIFVAVDSNRKEYRGRIVRSPKVSSDFDYEKLLGQNVRLIKRYYDPGYMLKVTPEMLEDPDTDDLGSVECLKEQSERMLEELKEHNRKFNPNAKLGTAEIKFEPMGVRNGNIRYGRVRKPTDDAFDPLQQPFLVQDKQGQEWKAWMVGSGEVSPIGQDVVCHFDGQRYVFQFHGVAVVQHGHAMKIEPDAIVLGKFSDAVGYGPDHS